VKFYISARDVVSVYFDVIPKETGRVSFTHIKDFGSFI